MPIFCIIHGDVQHYCRSKQQHLLTKVMWKFIFCPDQKWWDLFVIIRVLNHGVGLDGPRASVLEWITTSLNTDLTPSRHSCSITSMTMKFSVQLVLFSGYFKRYREINQPWTTATLCKRVVCRIELPLKAIKARNIRWLEQVCIEAFKYVSTELIKLVQVFLFLLAVAINTLCYMNAFRLLDT